MDRDNFQDGYLLLDFLIQNTPKNCKPYIGRKHHNRTQRSRAAWSARREIFLEKVSRWAHNPEVVSSKSEPEEFRYLRVQMKF